MTEGSCEIETMKGVLAEHAYISYLFERLMTFLIINAIYHAPGAPLKYTILKLKFIFATCATFRHKIKEAQIKHFSSEPAKLGTPICKARGTTFLAQLARLYLYL